VKSASEPGAIGRCVDKEGNLQCPECNPPVAYDLYAVGSCGGPKHVHDALFKLRADAMIASAVTAELRGQEERLRAEYERIRRIEVRTWLPYFCRRPAPPGTAPP